MVSITPLFIRACFIFFLVCGVVSGQINYTITNKCPSSVNVYIGGRLDSSLATGANTTRNLGADVGFFYSDANGGSVSGDGTRAGFYGDSQSHYYYLVKDPAQFNMGISITPNFPPTGGFCVVANCDNASCTTAFSQPPTRFPAPTSNAPPNPPVYSCPYADLAYDITFCPSGSFPLTGPASSRPSSRPASAVPASQVIRSNSNLNKCVDVRGAVFANGTPVQIHDCNGTGAQNWIINRGCTKIQLAGTNFCMDAGSTPGKGAGIQIWQCQENLPSQQWYYTSDQRIVLENTGLCLGLSNGQWPLGQWPLPQRLPNTDPAVP